MKNAKRTIPPLDSLAAAEIRIKTVDPKVEPIPIIMVSNKEIFLEKENSLNPLGSLRCFF